MQIDRDRETDRHPLTGRGTNRLQINVVRQTTDTDIERDG